MQAETIQKVQSHQPAISDPILIDIIHDGLLRFHRRIELIDPSQYPDRYHRLIQTQNIIGWDQLYRGRWSLEWRKMHNEYAQSLGPDRQTAQGQSWLLSMGRLLIDQWLALWKLRNTERHGKDEQQQHEVRLRTLKSELHELYQYRNQVCPADRYIFYQNVETHLEHHSSLNHLEDWITIHRDAIKASVHQANTLGLRRNRMILDYPTFNPIA